MQIEGADIADQKSAQNTFYDMSYWLGCTEDDAKVRNVVDEVQEYHNAQDRRKWVEWAYKILMP
jgi:hypothetical protein